MGTGILVITCIIRYMAANVEVLHNREALGQRNALEQRSVARAAWLYADADLY